MTTNYRQRKARASLSARGVAASFAMIIPGVAFATMGMFERIADSSLGALAMGLTVFASQFAIALIVWACYMMRGRLPLSFLMAFSKQCVERGWLGSLVFGYSASLVLGAYIDSFNTYLIPFLAPLPAIIIVMMALVFPFIKEIRISVVNRKTVYWSVLMGIGALLGVAIHPFVVGSGILERYYDLFPLTFEWQNAKECIVNYVDSASYYYDYNKNVFIFAWPWIVVSIGSIVRLLRRYWRNRRMEAKSP